MRRRRQPVAIPILLAGLWGAAGADAGPRLETVHKVVLEIRPLNAAVAPEEPYRLVVDPVRGAEVEVAVAWPDAGTPSTLRLEAVEKPSPAADVMRVELRTELRFADGAATRATRTIDVREGVGSVLFEIARHEERTLTLGIQAETVSETVYQSHPTVGAPVVFRLEVQHVIQGKAISLETNRLSTFVGEPVTYSFSLGSTGEGASIRLRLEPVRRHGDLVHVETEVTGTVPAEDGMQVVSRTERLIASRGAVSTIAVESGEPPSGYRFLVTPQW